MKGFIMLAALATAYAFAKPYASKALSLAPFPIGVAAGYLGHPFISLALDALKGAMSLAKHL